MPRPLPVLPLRPGRVLRTRDLERWSSNPSRLAARLVERGDLTRLRQGLYACPRQSRFGNAPPADDDILRAFLGGTPFVVTGPPAWNALGLGTTAVHAVTLVYNTKRTATIWLGGRRFRLRRVGFPGSPPPEWFAVDLLNHAGEAGASQRELAAAILGAVRSGRLDARRLRAMATRHAPTRVRALLGALDGSRAPGRRPRHRAPA